MTNESAVSNRGRALDAALQIAGSQGIRALTHGRVDSVAGLPKGSTSNHFRTRAALIHATVDYLVEAERGAFAEGNRPRSVEDLVQALAVFVDHAAGPQRMLTAARFAFFVEGFHDAHVHDALAHGRARIETWAALTLEELGFPRPFAATRRILTYIEGAIFHRLTFDDAPGIYDDLEAIVRSCGD
ncbi:TetR/AcrR family transcriptional regulator [Phytoactinopolyspora limicola]|uniref:TetR/AcrR family transcriptional regulator n=1 Tax=Phytoactinopolyspora limicola TaxID=2715536 RepID=UPI00140D50AB|nr:TetR family transcriptional regulator [Phytoactinopolyspora limicola]